MTQLAERSRFAGEGIQRLCVGRAGEAQLLQHHPIAVRGLGEKSAAAAAASQSAQDAERAGERRRAAVVAAAKGERCLAEDAGGGESEGCGLECWFGPGVRCCFCFNLGDGCGSRSRGGCRARDGLRLAGRGQPQRYGDHARLHARPSFVLARRQQGGEMHGGGASGDDGGVMGGVDQQHRQAPVRGCDERERPERNGDRQSQPPERAEQAARWHGLFRRRGLASAPQLAERVLEARLHQPQQREPGQDAGATGQRLDIVVGLPQEERARRHREETEQHVRDTRQRAQVRPAEDRLKAEPYAVRRLAPGDGECEPEHPQRRSQRGEAAFRVRRTHHYESTLAFQAPRARQLRHSGEMWCDLSPPCSTGATRARFTTRVPSVSRPTSVQGRRALPESSDPSPRMVRCPAAVDKARQQWWLNGRPREEERLPQ